MSKLIVDCGTGEAHNEPLTEAEEASVQREVARAEEERTKPQPPTAEERLADLEARIDAAAALAADANATAQEVAAAMRDNKPTR